jgi:serine/threonine protein kinase
MQVSVTTDPLNVVGRTLAGRFLVERLVGNGRIGPLYRGTQDGGDPAEVAIRFLHLENLVAPERLSLFVERFRDRIHGASKTLNADAQVARAIGSGTTAGEDGNLVYTVLEWFEGRSLAVELEDRRGQGMRGRSLREVVDLLTPAAEALAYAHDLGLFHGDITPGALFHAPTLRILDFGIAHTIRDLARELDAVARTDLLVSRGYAAPEQLDGKHGGGPPTDVYSLALVLLEMLTDRPARTGTSPPSLAGLELGPKLAILERALAPAPAERFQNAGELWDAMTSDMRASAPALTVVPADPSAAPTESPASSSRWAPEVRTSPTIRAVLPSMRPPAAASPEATEVPSMRPAVPSAGPGVPSAPPVEAALPSMRPQATTLPGDAETFFEVLPPPHLLAAIQEAIAGPPPPEAAPPAAPPVRQDAAIPALEARREAAWREHTRRQTTAVIVVVIVAVGVILLMAALSVWFVTRSRSSLVLPMGQPEKSRKEAGSAHFV